MSSSLNWLRSDLFGPEYEQLLLRAFAADKELLLEFGNAKTARGMRARVYSYFKMLRHENLRLDLIEKAADLKICIKGTSLCIFHKVQSWDSKMLRASLGLPEDWNGGRDRSLGLTDSIIDADSGQKKLLEKLEEIRAAKGT